MLDKIYFLVGVDMKKMKSLLVIIMTFLIFISCDSEISNTTTSYSQETLKKLQVTVASIPENINGIIGILSSSEYDTITKEFTITTGSAYCIFKDIPVGNWHIVVRAYSNSVLIYEGESALNVSEGNISYITVYMNKVENVGTVQIGLIWDGQSEMEYVYNFDTDDLSGWYGSAFASIENNQLVVSETGYVWHTIEYDGDTDFISGSIEYDVYPLDGYIAFYTKGDTYLDGSLNWGIYLDFRNDSVFVRQHNESTQLLYTNYNYNDNTWYHIEINFDNTAGEKGRYDLWISEIQGESDPVYLGQFDYYASKGRLIGINQFVISNINLEDDIIKKGIYDNIRFYNLL